MTVLLATNLTDWPVPSIRTFTLPAALLQINNARRRTNEIACSENVPVACQIRIAYDARD